MSTPPDSGVKVVVTGKDGHGHATVPASHLAPLRFQLGLLR
jgi:hypothetical protein